MSASSRQETIIHATVARTAPRTSAKRVSAAVELNATALLRFFSRRVEQPEDAADLLGETLLAVWRRARSIPGDDAGARMRMYGIAKAVELFET